MDNITKVITIAKVEMTAYESGNQYKITSTDNVKYKFYDKKKDGTSTVAFQQFQDMGLKIGSTCEVWFKELQKEYQGKPYTDRIIASFKEAPGQTKIPQTIQTTTPPIKINPMAVFTPTESFKQRNFKQEGLEKCLWNYWLELTAQQIELTPNWKDLVYQAFNEINTYSQNKFQKSDEPLPEPPPENEYDNLPF